MNAAEVIQSYSIIYGVTSTFLLHVFCSTENAAPECAAFTRPWLFHIKGSEVKHEAEA